MDGRNPREKWELKLDLVEHLVELGYILPEDSVDRSTIEGWFSDSEQELAEEIVNDLLENPDAPVATTDTSANGIGITDYEAANEFKDSLWENPPWFEQ